MTVADKVTIPASLLDETIEALERIGCQYNYCDGPTLKPVAMVTCFACDLLARLRVAAGRPPRRNDELTALQYDQDRHERYMAAATGRR